LESSALLNTLPLVMPAAWRAFLVVIVTLTPCGVILDFVVYCQVFGLMLHIHCYDSKKNKV
jgi:hypothetical protein